MAVRKKVQETLDETRKMVDEGARETGVALRGVAREVDKVMRSPEVRGVIDSTGRLIDRGVKKVGDTIARDPELKDVVDKGVRAVSKAIDAGVEVARKGVEKGEEILTGKKRERRAR